jgi:hypothetical protein
MVVLSSSSGYLFQIPPTYKIERSNISLKKCSASFKLIELIRPSPDFISFLNTLIARAFCKVKNSEEIHLDTLKYT